MQGEEEKTIDETCIVLVGDDVPGAPRGNETKEAHMVMIEEKTMARRRGLTRGAWCQKIAVVAMTATAGRCCGIDLVAAWICAMWLLLDASRTPAEPVKMAMRPAAADTEEQADEGSSEEDDDDDETDDSLWQINVVQPGNGAAAVKAATKGGPRPLAQGILVDSGAGVSIADGSEAFPEYPLEESAGSRSGQTYAGARKGDTIPNRGQRQVKLRLGDVDGERAAMRIQDAPVRRPILAVSDSNDAGNLLVFDREGSVILPKGVPEIAAIRQLVAQAKRKIQMKRERGIFTLDAWVEEPAACFRR